MRLLTAFATAGFLAGCSAPPLENKVEDFSATFERMQASQGFLESRTLPEFLATEEFGDDSETAVRSRPIPCSISEMHAAGWDVLPASNRLTVGDATYTLEATNNAQEVSVVLGVAEGIADARYLFRARGGEWHLIRMEVYSHAPGVELPSLPCKPKA